MPQPYLIFAYVCDEIAFRRYSRRMSFAERARCAATYRNRVQLLFYRSLRQAQRIWIRSASIQVAITNVNHRFSIRVPGQFTDVSSVIAFVGRQWPGLK